MRHQRPGERGATRGQPSRRRLRRSGVRGPHCPLCGGPVAYGEGARLCLLCGRREPAAPPYSQPGDRSAA